MINWLQKKFTKNYTEVPLFYVTFNLKKYKLYGEKGSCDLRLHSSLNDKHIRESLEEIINYIRENYDLETVSK